MCTGGVLCEAACRDGEARHIQTAGHVRRRLQPATRSHVAHH